MREFEITNILQRPYQRRVELDKETGRWSAEITEFSGCFADGSTFEEAAYNLEIAAASWILAVLERGQGIPEVAQEVVD